jgi:precorrin-8X/cobalt-precorrin-8 methylmutase
LDSPRTISSIEQKSFEIIRSTVDLSHFTTLEAEVVARVIHATADPTYASTMRFTPNAVEAGIAAVSMDTPIVTDVTMVASGITTRPAVSAIATFHPTSGSHTRSYATMMAAVRHYGPHAIYVIGCSPTSLEALLDAELPESPHLVIATPVGYVGAAEIKARLRTVELCSISNEGALGGSAVAAAITNALLYLHRGERHLHCDQGA